MISAGAFSPNEANLRSRGVVAGILHSASVCLGLSRHTSALIMQAGGKSTASSFIKARPVMEKEAELEVHGQSKGHELRTSVN